MTDNITLILALLPIHLAVMVSPGPNFVLLSTTALSTGRNDALRVALGISVGSLVWMVAAVAGVSIIMDALPILSLALKIIGGMYLIYLGYKLLISKGMTSDGFNRVETKKKNSFRRGLISNLTNPKSAAYFGSIFAAFLTEEVSSFALASLIPLLFLLSIAWHSALATAFSVDAVRKPYLRYSRVINLVAGTTLLALGLRMAGTALLN